MQGQCAAVKQACARLDKRQKVPGSSPAVWRGWSLDSSGWSQGPVPLYSGGGPRDHPAVQWGQSLESGGGLRDHLCCMAGAVPGTTPAV